MTEKISYTMILILVQTFCYALMIHVGKHAIHKSTHRIIWIARLIRFYMMNMMGYHINFFGKSFNNQVLGYQTEYRMAELIRLMCTIAMKPDRSMRAHNYHGIYNQHNG